MCRLIIILKTLDDDSVVVSLVYGVNAKMKKFLFDLNNFFDSV